ncbi:helix-hairpin-helix domain-containing protein [Streptomyces sp. NPDC004647]|uniref:helix-hairpin-helix domain-containing protein n=1 Tax=Streptomyces sp. NPDC004647 TaxID=3154671 RepID=UPI0033AF02EF
MTTDRPVGEGAAAPAPEDAAPARDDRPQSAGRDAAGARGGETAAAPEEAGAEGRHGDATAPAAAAPESGESSAKGSADDGRQQGGAGRPAAEALTAAVKAVERGERPAASFFTQQQSRQTAPGAGGSGQQAAGSGAAGRGGPVRPAPGTGAGPGGGGPTGPAPGGAPEGPVSGPRDVAPVRGDLPETLSTAAGPGPARSGPPAARHPAQSGTVREVLAAGGAPEALADAALETLGERAAHTLREDPWQLLTLPGVRPDQADGFARALLGSEAGPGDARRARALVHWLLERAALEGHTALEPSALSSALAQQSVPDPEEALRTAIADGGVLVFQDALDTPGATRTRSEDEEEGEEQPVRVLLGLDRYALAEESLADGLARLLNTFAPESGSVSRPADADTDASDAEATHATAGASAADWQTAARSAQSPSAAELIRAAAESGLVVHTGGEAARAEPEAVVAAARALGLRAYAAVHSEAALRRPAGPGDAATADSQARRDEAPAGDGRGDRTSGPGDAAVTVAGLLSGAEGPGRDQDGMLALDVLAVLDAPQLDVETAAMLVESLPDGARLVLSGDPGVLWSAGPGRVFADVLAARTCPQVASRTPDTGPIGELVSGIGIGELSQVEAPGKEVVIVPVRDAGEAVHRTVQLVADSVPRAIGVPSDRTQVITPGHGGAAGTRALNAALKERLNPGPGRFGGFDPGDRVACVPAPGRTLPGTVVSADADGLHLDCAGEKVVVPPGRVAGTVRHGWALTAHQAAGMRWPAAVVVLPGDATRGLTRSWVYTAFGRAEQHLSVVHGAEQALPRAVAEVPVMERTTRLRTLLQTLEPPAG